MIQEDIELELEYIKLKTHNKDITIWETPRAKRLYIYEELKNRPEQPTEYDRIRTALLQQQLSEMF